MWPEQLITLLIRLDYTLIHGEPEERCETEWARYHGRRLLSVATHAAPHLPQQGTAAKSQFLKNKKKSWKIYKKKLGEYYWN